MKDFIRVANNLIVPIDQIDKIHILETMARLFVYQQGQKEVYKDFETPEEARAEFERISQLLLNPLRVVSATEVRTYQPGFSLGPCPEIESLNDSEYLTRLAHTFRKLGLTADAERLEQLQLVDDLKLAP